MPTHSRKTYSRVALFALAGTLIVGASTFALARRKPALAPAPATTETFASPRFGHSRPIPPSTPDAAPTIARNEFDAGGSSPQPIRTVAELDRYLDSLLLYAQYDPSVAGDVAEEGVALMNSLVNELGGLDRTLEKEETFTTKLQQIAETPATQPATDPPEMNRLLSAMGQTSDSDAQGALLSEYLDAMSRAPPGERGYWLEQLKQANLEDHRAPAADGLSAGR